MFSTTTDASFASTHPRPLPTATTTWFSRGPVSAFSPPQWRGDHNIDGRRKKNLPRWSESTSMGRAFKRTRSSSASSTECAIRAYPDHESTNKNHTLRLCRDDDLGSQWRTGHFLLNSSLFSPLNFLGGRRKFGLGAPPVPHRARYRGRGISIGVSALGIGNYGRDTIKRSRIPFIPIDYSGGHSLAWRWANPFVYCLGQRMR